MAVFRPPLFCYCWLMLIRTNLEKIFFAILLAFLCITIGKDWYDFYTCGAVGQCISAAGQMQYITKFVMSSCLTVLAYLMANRAFCARDGRFLRLAFCFSLLADFGFSVFNIIFPDNGSLSTVLGIGFFMVFQTILIYRHTRRDEQDKSFPKVFWIIVALAALFAGLAVAGIIGAIVAEVLVYGGFVITSMVVGILAPRKAYFPKKNALFIRWGVVAFFIGDVLVGLSMLSGEDHSVLQLISCIANNMIWLAYVPAQLMLIRGAAKE